MKKYKSWCRYCGASVDKMPVKTGNTCYECKIKRARLYWLKKQNAKTKRPSRNNAKGLSRKQK